MQHVAAAMADKYLTDPDTSSCYNQSGFEQTVRFTKNLFKAFVLECYFIP